MDIKKKLQSKDNMSIKYVQKTDDSYLIETVWINQKRKHIICFSSQIGCTIGCNFCYTGINSKYYRNLTSDEMVDQCTNAIEDGKLRDKSILFSCMGVGEPLLNYENVIKAIKELNHKYPGNKFALATTGILPNLILGLSEDLKDIDDFKLTISLHGVNDEIRKQIIPKSINIKELIRVVRKYEKNSGKKVEWNYVLLNGLNDTEKDAYDLIKLLGKNEYIKINKYNDVVGSKFVSSSDDQIIKFINVLKDNINYEYYETNGADIMGACGQMSCEKE